MLSALQDAVDNGDIGIATLRAAVGDLYSIPGLGARGRATADAINKRVDEILKEFIQR